MYDYATSVTIGTVIKTSGGDYTVWHIGKETTGNIHALGIRTDERGDLEYAVFGTNGDKADNARLYRNYITNDPTEACKNYMVMTGILDAAKAVIL